MSAPRWRWLGILVALVAAWSLYTPSPPQAPAESPPAPAALASRSEPVRDEMSWDGVDLEQVRAALPDNLYWQLGHPTDDPAVLALRQAEAAARNEAFGAIQSGNATVQEIHSYYAEREQISRDYVAFAEYILSHHGEQLAERDLGLLELAREMNEKRLAQLPTELERALARKSQQDEARETWSELTTSEGGP